MNRANNTSQTDAQRGASMLEYALLVALIGVIAIVAIRAVGVGVNQNFDRARNEIAATARGDICTAENPEFPDCL